MERFYLDNSATTRVDPLVAEECLHAMLKNYGNPSSLHRMGLDAQLAIENAQKRILAAMRGEGQVIFTSGGTEANNLAIFGAAFALRRRGNGIVTTAFEHASVLAPMAELEKQGFLVRRVKSDTAGLIDPLQIAEACDKDTILVSVMLVNNELGSIIPLEETVRLVRKKSPLALIHCDAVQAFGKLPFSASALDLDLVSISGHKIHAPKGVGGLYIKKGVRISPMIFGGGQQKDLRPGTENVPLICGFGLAASLASGKLLENYAAAAHLKEQLIAGLAGIEGAVVNSPASSSHYILNFSIPGYRSETLLHLLEGKGVYVSSGSACSKGKRSHVLLEAGLPDERIDSAIRVSFSRYSSEQDVDALLNALVIGLPTLRRSR